MATFKPCDVVRQRTTSGYRYGFFHKDNGDGSACIRSITEPNGRLIMDTSRIEVLEKHTNEASVAGHKNQLAQIFKPGSKCKFSTTNYLEMENKCGWYFAYMEQYENIEFIIEDIYEVNG